MEFPSLETRMDALEQRFSVIEQKLNISNQARPDPWQEPPPGPDNKAHQKEKIIADFAPKSGNWLGIIAVICFVFAAGFIIKLSIETGWLTPARQIIIAALFGCSLIGTGLALLNTYRGYASLLPAAGIVILYLSVCAAYTLYNLVPVQMALVLTTLVSAFCIGLYVRIKHDIYAIAAAVGAYLGPVMLGFQTIAIFSVYYFVCCSLTFAILSIWVRARILTIAAAYLAILMTSVIGFDLNQDLLIASVLVFHFFIFTLGTYLYTRLNHLQLTETEAWGFFPVLLLFYAMEYFFIERIQPGLAPWLSLLFAGLLISLYLSAKKWFPNGSIKSQPMILAFASVVFFHSFYLVLLPDTLKPWLFVAIMLAGVFLPANPWQQNKRAFFLPLLVIYVILAIEYINIISHLTGLNQESWLLVATAAFVSIWAMLLMHPGDGKSRDQGLLLLGAAHVLAISGLYRLADPHGSLAVSACWLFYALAVMGFAYSRRDRMMAKSALFVLGLAAGKALLYDAASTPTTVRILCLLLTGVVLYGAGFLMKKIAEWDS